MWLASRHISGNGPHLAWRGEPPGFTRVAAGALDLRKGPQGPALVASGKASHMRVARGPLGIPLPSMPGPKTLCVFPTVSEKICALIMETGPWTLRPVSVQHFSSFFFSFLVLWGFENFTCLPGNSDMLWNNLLSSFQHFCGFVEDILRFSNPLYFKK